MGKTYSADEIRNSIIEIQDGAVLMTPEQRVSVFLTSGIIEENQVLGQCAMELINRGQVPKHALKSVFRQIAEKRNYFYFQIDPNRGIFLHLSRFTEVLKKIREYVTPTANA